MSDVLRTFGARLRTLRTLQQLSQEQLASIANLDRTYISLLERGKRNPSLICMETIAIALNTTLSDLCRFKRGKSYNDH